MDKLSAQTNFRRDQRECSSCKKAQFHLRLCEDCRSDKISGGFTPGDVISALHAHLGEYGIVKDQGPAGVNSLLAPKLEAQDAVPVHARSALRSVVARFHALAGEIEHLEKQIPDWHRHDKVRQRLATVPGIGPMTASANVATVPDASIFRSVRQFAAWLGLTPRPHSSGGKERLGRHHQAG